MSKKTIRKKDVPDKLPGGRTDNPPLTMSPVNDIVNVSPYVEYGRSGVRRFGMFVLDDLLQELQSSFRSVQVYREMADNDPAIGSMLFAIKMLCRAVDWYVTPASDNEADIRAKEFLWQCMNDMETTWGDVINEILSFITYGWAVCEVVYKQRLGPDQSDPSKRSKYNDGLIGWRKISLRSQHTLYGWIFAEDGSGDVVAMRQLSPPDFKIIDIPLSKCLHFRTETTRGNPEGRSILRNCVRPWKFKQQIEVLEGIGIERDLAGLPVVRIPSRVIVGQDPESRAAYQQYIDLATNIRRDSQEGIVLPSDVYDGTSIRMYDIELVSSSGSRQINTNEVISRYNTQILSTMLADFISLGHDASGSKSMIQTKVDVFKGAIEAFLDIIAEVFNRVAVPMLFKLNPEISDGITGYPIIQHEHIMGPDIEVLGSYLRALKYSGVPIAVTNELLRYLYSIVGMPEPSVDADDLRRAMILDKLLLDGKIPPEEGNILEMPDVQSDEVRGIPSSGIPGRKPVSRPLDASREEDSERDEEES